MDFPRRAALVLAAGLLPPLHPFRDAREDVAGALRDLEASDAETRRNAERFLLLSLTPADEPDLLGSLRSGGLEARRRLVRILGARVDFLPFLVRSAASDEPVVSETAADGLRLFLRGTRLWSAGSLVEYGEGSVPRLFGTGPLRVDARREPLDRLVEALQRTARPLAPLLLDPRLLSEGAAAGPRVPDAEYRGDPSSVLQAVLESAGLRWIQYTQILSPFDDRRFLFCWITKEEPPDDPAEIFILLAKLYGRGAPAVRRLAGIDLGLLAIDPVLQLLADDALRDGEGADDALVGLFAGAGDAAIPLPPDLRDRALAGLESPDPQVRRACGYALAAALPSTPGLEEEILRRLPAWGGGLRAAGLVILRESRDSERAIDCFRREARHPDPRVAEAALQGLEAARVPAVEASLDALARPRVPAPLASAAEGLLLASRPPLEAIEEALRSPPSPLRRACRAALPSLGPDGIARFCALVADSAEPDVLEGLGAAAARAVDPRALAAALEEHRRRETDGNRRLRLEIVSGLSGLAPGDAELRASLFAALRRADRLGSLAARAYGRSLGPEGPEELFGLYTSESRIEKERALEGLVQYFLSLPVGERTRKLMLRDRARSSGLDLGEVREALRTWREERAPSLEQLEGLGRRLDEAGG